MLASLSLNSTVWKMANLPTEHSHHGASAARGPRGGWVAQALAVPAVGRRRAALPLALSGIVGRRRRLLVLGFPGWASALGPWGGVRGAGRAPGVAGSAAPTVLRIFRLASRTGSGRDSIGTEALGQPAQPHLVDPSPATRPARVPRTPSSRPVL
jgi:hypothetical protein